MTDVVHLRMRGPSIAVIEMAAGSFERAGTVPGDHLVVEPA